jgi:serine/threonine-protein kinase RsbW
VAASPAHLSIPSSTRYLSEVRAFVRERAEAAGFEESTVGAIALAVDEACTNVIEHAYGGVATSDGGELDTPVEVHIQADDIALVVCIRDRGVAFDRSAYEKPDIQKFAKRRKAGGFGVHIMHRLMDRVEYRTREGVNECILTKYRA